MQKQKVKVVYRYVKSEPRKVKLSTKLKGYWRELNAIAKSPTAKRAVKLLARAGQRSAEQPPFVHSRFTRIDDEK